MLMTSSLVCGVERSILGQPWRWRGAARRCARRGLPARRSGRPAAARPRRRARGAGAAPGADDPRLHARSVASSATWTRRPSGSPTRSRRGEPVTIFGDYDVDGATSAALLIRLLRELGCDPQAYIPDRLMEGYGPSGEALVRIAEGGAQLIVTVDCGAQAFEALEMARAAGVDVIVVDHHKCASRAPGRLRPGQSRTGSTKPTRPRRTAISPRSASASCSAPPWCARCAARGFFADRDGAAAGRPARSRRARHGRRRRPASRASTAPS